MTIAELINKWKTDGHDAKRRAEWLESRYQICMELEPAIREMLTVELGLNDIDANHVRVLATIIAFNCPK